MNSRRNLRLKWIAAPSMAILLAAAMSAEHARDRENKSSSAPPVGQLAQAQSKPAAGAPPAKRAATKAANPEEQSREQDEKQIRATVSAMSKAFNAKDAAAVAELFTSGAEIIDEDGETFQGRDDIKEVFAAGFKDNPKSQIKILVDSIRFVCPTVAIEQGFSTIRRGANDPIARSPYTVVHVKQDGKWLMALARDFPDESPEPGEELKRLAPMIGDWVDESPESLTKTSYKWDEDHLYIMGEFTLQITGRPTLSGSVRIGWDPLAKKIHSWVFDSKGGFAEGTWTQDESRWVVKMTGVSSDGKASSATNITTFVSKDHMIWESRDRVLGDDVAPDIEKIHIVRKPPQAL